VTAFIQHLGNMSNVEQKLGMSLDDLINQQKTKQTVRKRPAAPVWSCLWLGMRAPTGRDANRAPEATCRCCQARPLSLTRAALQARGTVQVQGSNTRQAPGRNAPTTVRVQGRSASKVLPARQGRQQQQQRYAQTGRGSTLGVSRGGVRKAGQPGRVLVVPR
jgi:hypothetical protein